MSGEARFELVLGFDSDSPDFLRGFEAGELWATLGGGGSLSTQPGEQFPDLPVEDRAFAEQAEFSLIMHATNAEMIMRICEAKKRSFRAVLVDDTFLLVLIGRSQ